jgi:hypothetical protein
LRINSKITYFPWDDNIFILLTLTYFEVLKILLLLYGKIQGHSFIYYKLFKVIFGSEPFNNICRHILNPALFGPYNIVVFVLYFINFHWGSWIMQNLLHLLYWWMIIFSCWEISEEYLRALDWLLDVASKMLIICGAVS